MATRIIEAAISSGANTNLTPGGRAEFAVVSDSGANWAGMISSARLTLSSICTYASTFQLAVDFGGDVLARTESHKANSEPHSETVSLSDLADGLLTDEPGTITLTVKKISGSGNKINFRSGCKLTLEVDYSESVAVFSSRSTDATECEAATNVRLSSTKTYGENVTLSWEYPGEPDTLDKMYLCTEMHWVADDGKSYSSSTTAAVSINNSSPPVSYSREVSAPPAPGGYCEFCIKTVKGTTEKYSETVTLYYVKPTLVPYTDATIVPGVTRVKAAHIKELQTNVNAIREYKRMSRYSFTSVSANFTPLQRWTRHVTELRNAIDEIGISHETWISFSVNQPRADIMMQIRRVVDALS